jgi:pantoate--beta-alanine ligase
MNFSLQVFETRKQLLDGLLKTNEHGDFQKGFVPTMGALHEGHLSLVRTALEHTDVVIVSIFVNPTQFNSEQDLLNYPRQFVEDLQKLESLNNKNIVVFKPSIEEMYPDGTHNIRHYDLGGLDKVMEGKFRPGHFQGVATIVHRLLDMVRPHKAFFGEKDYQQLSVIKHVVSNLNLPVEIIGVPTLREDDGLAMSSRNALLKPEYRKVAARIFSALQELKENFRLELAEIKTQQAISTIEGKDSLLKVEYLEIADNTNLQRPTSDNQKIRAFVAVWANNVRLIDNIPLN